MLELRNMSHPGTRPRVQDMFAQCQWNQLTKTRRFRQRMVKMGFAQLGAAAREAVDARAAAAATVAAEAETDLPVAGAVVSLSFRLRPKRRRSPCGRARPEHRVAQE